MTIANNIIALALKNAGINGIGQTASAEDTNDAFTLLNDMINQWAVQRAIMVIPGTLITFPDLTTDVAFWTGNENVLLTTLAVRLRSAYNLPADDLMNQIAESTLQQLQANNKQFQPPLHGGITTTPIQIIFLALRMAKRIDDKQSVADSSADVDSAFSLLVNMLAQWQRKRWLVPNEIDLAITSTGAVSYTIGPARPDKIQAAYCRILNAGSPNLVDVPLTVIESHEDYSKLCIKTLGTFPAAVFYDTAWPIGNIYVWPVPPANLYEIHVVFKSPLPAFVTVNDALGLPFEYNEAIISNLACRIMALNGMDPSPGLMGAAKAALNTIRMANVQISMMQLPNFNMPRGSIAASASPSFQTGWW